MTVLSQSNNNWWHVEAAREMQKCPDSADPIYADDFPLVCPINFAALFTPSLLYNITHRTFFDRVCWIDGIVSFFIRCWWKKLRSIQIRHYATQFYGIFGNVAKYCMLSLEPQCLPHVFDDFTKGLLLWIEGIATYYIFICWVHPLIRLYIE